MRLAHRSVVAAALLVVSAPLTAATAGEPKHGGILKIYHRDSPPSASILEEGDVLDGDPVHGNLQQSRPVQTGCPAKQLPIDCAGSGKQLVVVHGQ